MSSRRTTLVPLEFSSVLLDGEEAVLEERATKLGLDAVLVHGIQQVRGVVGGPCHPLHPIPSATTSTNSLMQRMLCLCVPM